MEIGQIFKVKDEEFGFVGLTTRKCVQAYDIAGEKGVQFKMAYSKEVLIPMLETDFNPRISQDAVDYAAQMQDKEYKRQGLMYSLRRGDRFIGQDDKIYTFIEVKQTRFACERDGQSFTAQAGFIKDKM
jgi:hypothetical protein